MLYNILINAEAEDDTIAAVDYYDMINSDISERFLTELKHVYEKIAGHPQYYKYVSKKKKNYFRCTKLKSFPYLVIFRVQNDAVIVVSVLHTNRRTSISLKIKT